jgi:hypothetical protein
MAPMGPGPTVAATLLIIFSGALQACGSEGAEPPRDVAIADTGTGGDAGCDPGECVDASACVDEDGDGFGPGCRAGDDCDDSSPTAFPGGFESCDGLDNDCDGEVDEDGACDGCAAECEVGARDCAGDAVVACTTARGCPAWSAPEACLEGETCFDGACVVPCSDADGDGYPIACTGERADCDDGDASRFPRNPETCDGRDNDCDGDVDEGGVCAEPCDDACIEGNRVCSTDGREVLSCEQLPNWCTGFVQAEVCDGACVLGVCEDVPACVDLDGDGAGPGCELADCRPLDAAVFPGATEVCNGIDDNCNGSVDESVECDACLDGRIDTGRAFEAPGAHHRVACAEEEWVPLGPGVRGDGLVVALGDEEVHVDLGLAHPSFRAITTAGQALGPAAMVSGPIHEEVDVVGVRAPVGTRYTLVAGFEPTDCTADPYEPNGSPATATPVGDLPFGVFGSICAADLDFYAINTVAGEVITVAAAFDAENSGDALANVWWNGVEVGVMHVGSFDGSLPVGRHTHFRADLPGRYVIGVRGRDASHRTSYALAATSLSLPCDDDAFDPGDGTDDDAIATASAVTGGDTGERTLCPGDIDVIDLGEFRVGQAFDGTFEIVAGSRQVDMMLVRDTMRTIFIDGTSELEELRVTAAIPDTGRYYLVVHGRTPDATARYRFTY